MGLSSSLYGYKIEVAVAELTAEAFQMHEA